MVNNDDRIIFHLDVNSAFLSWSAVDRLQHGENRDLREIPSAVGGDVESRHGIILAKSIPAKKFEIQTGEPLFSAREKCPELVLVPPQYELYLRCSNAMLAIMKEYTPVIERYSIDECFMDFTSVRNLYKDPVETAYKLKDRIKRELGFTVNVGVSTNKLLAKMASELKKPDMVHTVFPDEIKEKLWPLPVEELFMVGRACAPKLNKLNIFTIGDLANYNSSILRYRLKSYGILIRSYANGIDDSPVASGQAMKMKSIGNSTTVPFDVVDRKTAHMVILSLAETVGMRLRGSENYCQLVFVAIKNSDFISFSRQRKLSYYTDSTMKIADEARELFDELWKGEPLRHIGLGVSHLSPNINSQLSLFDNNNKDKQRKLDRVIDDLRLKYGSNVLVRSVFLNSGITPVSGGVAGMDKNKERTTIF